jgi:hypothetical protein
MHRFPPSRPFRLIAFLGCAAASFAVEPPRPVLVSGRTAGPAEADVVRFLEQAAWGPTDALVARVEKIGFDAWISEQLEAPVSSYPALPPYPGNRKVGCPEGSDPNCVRDHYTMYPLQVSFFRNGLNGDDQLRQRVAFALHEILVVSGLKVKQPSAMAPYLNLLAADALGDFRTLLADVTLNPAMGDYLDMVDNDKADAAGTVQPNENYGREIMQLFSIGVHALSPDGSIVLDASGEPVPTYDQDTIEGFAHAFTGWTYAPLPGAPSRPHNPRNYLSPMVLYRDGAGRDANHDKGEKKLLSYAGAVRTTLPAGQDGRTDLDEALDNIAGHPNVGPFISRQLIQHLVTSNPSPDYVARVSRVFDDDGRGERGNLAAVVRAILLDPEARGARKTDAAYGRLREPVQFILGILRAFSARSDGVLGFAARRMGQDLFDPASVFSYYPHAYPVPGTSVEGPEFGIETTSTGIFRMNFVTALAFGKIPGGGTGGTSLDLAGLSALAEDPDALVERLDRLLLHGTMSDAMRETVAAAAAGSDPGLRAATALQLVAGSSQYQVER